MMQIKGGVVQCKICRKVAVTLKSRLLFKRQSCPGHFIHQLVDAHTLQQSTHRLDQPAPIQLTKGHRLMVVAPLMFCDKCGAYVKKGGFAKNIKKHCPGKPRNICAGILLRRLQWGIDPNSKQELGVLPRPFSRVEDADMIGAM